MEEMEIDKLIMDVLLSVRVEAMIDDQPTDRVHAGSSDSKSATWC